MVAVFPAQVEEASRREPEEAVLRLERAVVAWFPGPAVAASHPVLDYRWCQSCWWYRLYQLSPWCQLYRSFPSSQSFRWSRWFQSSRSFQLYRLCPWYRLCPSWRSYRWWQRPQKRADEELGPCFREHRKSCRFGVAKSLPMRGIATLEGSAEVARLRLQVERTHLLGRWLSVSYDLPVSHDLALCACLISYLGYSP